jgi:hypothetical protein
MKTAEKRRFCEVAACHYNGLAPNLAPTGAFASKNKGTPLRR